MESKVTIEYLANELGMSKSTVSRALNSCPGIRPATKRKILSVASDYGYKPERPPRKVSVILPGVPAYFWGQMRRNIADLLETAGIECRCFVYADMNHVEGALANLQDAMADSPSVLLVALPEAPEICRSLEDASLGALVLMIEESLAVKNAFFVGEDAYAEGLRLGRQYLTDCPEARRFAILRSTDFETERRRIAGFSAALAEREGCCSADIRLMRDSKTQSAALARELHAWPSLPDCIFCPSGSLTLAALAVKKLRAEGRMHCIGFDLNQEREHGLRHEVLTHVMVQDIRGQARLAAEYAKAFLTHATWPSQKNTYVPDLRHVIKAN